MKDDFSTKIKSAGAGVQSFASGAASAVQKVDKAFSGLATVAGAIGVSLSLGAATTEIINLDDKMNALGVQANASAEKINDLKTKIFETAGAPDIKLNTGDLTDALDSVIERTGDMKFAEDNLKSMAQAIRATGASGADIGGLYAEFQKMGLSAQDAAISLDTLTLQGKEGAFTLQNLATLGPRTINAYTATGRSGSDALREMGAALQVIRMGTGSSEQAATAFEAVMRNLTSPDKQAKLRQIGVTVKDQEGNFRSVTEIMQDIVTMSNGNTEVLGQVFDSEAMRAFNYAIGEYKRTGAVTSLQKFNDMLGDGSTIQSDAARRASTLKANVTGLQTAFVKFADSNLTAPLQKVTEALNKLAEDPVAFERIFKGIAVGLGAIAAVKGLAGIMNLVSGLKSLKGGKIQLGASAAGGNGMPVYVTNWGGTPGASPLPSSGSAGSVEIGKTPTGQKAGTPLSPGAGGTTVQRMSGAASQAWQSVTTSQKAMAGAAAGIGAAMVAIPQMVGELSAIKNNDTLSSHDKTVQKGGAIGDAAGTVVGATVGGAAGIAAGAAAGAAIGSIIPGLGTIVGGLVGAGVGALGGYLGGKAGRGLGKMIGGAVAGKDDVAHIAASDLPESIKSRDEKEFRGNVLSGNAELKTAITIEDKTIRAVQTVSGNSTPFSINTGSTAVARSMY